MDCFDVEQARLNQFNAQLRIAASIHSDSFRSPSNTTLWLTVAPPINSFAMYPPQGQNPSGNDANGFLSAVYTGTFDVPAAESVSFTLGSDDDSFLYVNGVLVTSAGGVHGDSPAPVVSQVLAPGTYTMNLFYDDRYPTAAALSLAVTTSNIVVNPPSGTPPTVTPEAASMGLFGVGMLAVLALVRVRRSRAESGVEHAG